MSSLPYMQLYVSDYLADTAHLNATQHGAYMLLLMNYAKGVEINPPDYLKDFFEETDLKWIPKSRHIKKIKKAKINSGRLAQNMWEEIRIKIFERDNYTCQYCGSRGGKLECDHIHPISRGGSNEESNLATSCFKCNRSKRAKTLDEWGFAK